ncbi:MAG TPA: RnfABCDGE type electron transport complex subunit G [Firmicutes bacterium]|nr:RnfABCDGE type electron transport complex subunit G [Bacillota bacterium]
MGKHEWRLILVLTVICVVSGGVLGWVNTLTAPAIRAQEELAKQRALQEALPGTTTFTEEPALRKELEEAGLAGIVEVYRAYRDEEEMGFVFTVDQQGYGGPIRMVIGVTASGNLSGLTVISHTETPGLGAKITDARFLTQPAFREAKTGEVLAVTKDKGEVDAITSATISSRAVVRGVNTALSAAQSLLDAEAMNGGVDVD